MLLKKPQPPLEVLTQSESSECPAFVPKVDALMAALADHSLPSETYARLMRHYEQVGQFAKAEDALFALLETVPNQPRVVEFGLEFYRRIQAQSDATLTAGSLPRAELEAGAAVLKGLIST